MRSEFGKFFLMLLICRLLERCYFFGIKKLLFPATASCLNYPGFAQYSQLDKGYGWKYVDFIGLPAVPAYSFGIMPMYPAMRYWIPISEGYGRRLPDYGGYEGDVDDGSNGWNTEYEYRNVYDQSVVAEETSTLAPNGN